MPSFLRVSVKFLFAPLRNAMQRCKQKLTEVQQLRARYAHASLRQFFHTVVKRNGVNKQIRGGAKHEGTVLALLAPTCKHNFLNFLHRRKLLFAPL